MQKNAVKHASPVEMLFSSDSSLYRSAITPISTSALKKPPKPSCRNAMILVYNRCGRERNIRIHSFTDS